MATVDEAFDASFNAGKGSIQASAAVPIGQLPPQATFAQATAINSFNALEAAITNNTNVQKQRADNADTIALATADASNKTALEVAQIAQQGIQAVQIGRDGLVQESLAAINAQKELSAIQANKPNALAHPIRWVADTLHANKLEDTIQTHAQAVQVYNRNINNVVQNTTVQVEEMLSIQNLVNSNGLRKMAVELNQGLDAQQAVAAGQKEKAVALEGTGKDIFSIAKANAEWAQADYRNQLAAEQNKIGKRANELQAEKMQREADAAKYREGAIKQAANFYLLAKNLPATEANRNMAMSMMTDMQAKGDPTFVAWSKAGAHAINSGDSKSAYTAVVQNSTVGEIAQLGALIGNADLAAIGGNRVNQLTQENEQKLKLASYNEAMVGKTGDAKMGQVQWENSLTTDQRKFFRNRAMEMAKNVVYNQSARGYMNGRAAGADIGQGAFSLAAFKSPLTLVNTYGISKQAAAVLADPKVQMFLAHAGAGSTQDKKTAQIVAMFEVLEKNKVANPAGVVALIGKKTGEAALDADLEAKTLGQYGVVSDSSGVVTYKDKQYRLGNPVDMDKMRIAATKKEGQGAFGIVGAAVDYLLPSQSAADVEAAKNLVKFDRGVSLQATPEQAAMTASQYTPAGHAPQVAGGIPATVQPVAGGIPATAQTEVEKVYDAVAVQLDQKNLRSETKQLANSVEADASYSVAAGQIEQKNTRAFTDKLAKDTAAEAAYSIVSGQIEAKGARANSKQLANSVEADAAYATVAAQLDQKAARAYTNKLFEEIMALKDKGSKAPAKKQDGGLSLDLTPLRSK